MPSVDKLIKTLVDTKLIHDCNTMLDIGCGSGKMLGLLLDKYPSHHGIFYDSAEVISIIKQQFVFMNIYERCKFTHGNFFVDIPENSDLFFMRYVLHNWSDEQAVIILKNCRNAMCNNARLLIIETINSDANDNELRPLLDLNMFVIFGARLRFIHEYEKLLNVAKLKLNKVIPVGLHESILECYPI